MIRLPGARRHRNRRQASARRHENRREGCWRAARQKQTAKIEKKIFERKGSD
jgi:hypothetical protein